MSISLTIPTPCAYTSTKSDRTFFFTMGIVFALITLVGFAPTYYLRPLSNQPPLSLLVHVHAMAMTVWMALFIVQTALVRADRRDLHKFLGLIAVGVFILIAWAGVMTAIESAAAGKGNIGGRQLTPEARLYRVFVGNLLHFVGYAIAGFCFRRRAATHKRLMLLAAGAAVGPALSRIHQLFELAPIFHLLPLIGFMAVYWSYDLVKYRRIHPAYILAVVVSLATRPHPINRMIMESETWHHIARWLISN